MEHKIEEIKSNCIKSWNNDYELDCKLKRFDENFTKWIENIPSDKRDIVLTLVKELKYYPRKFVNKYLSELHLRLNDDYGVNEDNTIYTFIKTKDGKSNSSNDYWTEYKFINNINNYASIEDYTKIPDEQWKYIENIVFIDDFSGTGKSFLKEINKKIEKFKNKNIFFLIINIMSKGYENIKEFGDENGITIIPLYIDIQTKAFETNYFIDNELAKKQTIEMSGNFGINKSFILGYDESQSLVAFYNNTPNNSLGFIWCDTEKYKSLFPRRHDTIPKWKIMKKIKKKEV